jgi:hypothetical protein
VQEGKMKVDKSKLKEPPNSDINREKLAETMLNDMSFKEMRKRVKEQLMNSYRISKQVFLREYWTYYEETWGHCPLDINND